MANKKQAEMDFALVKLDSIQAILEDNTRVYYPPKRIAALVKDIRRQGLINPIIVTPDNAKANRFRLVLGYCRYKALCEIDPKQEVRVQVVKDKDTKELLLLNASENMQREELTTYEQARACTKLLTEHEMSHAQVGSHLGLSKSTVTTNNTLITKLHPKILKIWADPEQRAHGLCIEGTKQGLTAINALQDISKLSHDEQWNEWEIRTGVKEAPSPDPDPDPNPNPDPSPPPAAVKATLSQIKRAHAACKTAHMTQAVSCLAWVLEGKDKPLKLGRKVVFDPSATEGGEDD